MWTNCLSYFPTDCTKVRVLWFETRIDRGDCKMKGLDCEPLWGQCMNCGCTIGPHSGSPKGGWDTIPVAGALGPGEGTEGSMFGESCLLPRGSLVSKVQPGLLPSSVPHPSCLCISSLPTTPCCPSPLAGVKGQPPPRYPAPAQPRPSLLPGSQWTPHRPRPLPSSLSSMSLTEKQMDSLTS